MGLYAVPPVELIADSVLCFSTLLKKPAHIEVKHNLLYWIKKFTSDVQVSARKGLGSDSRLYYWVNNRGWSSLNPPGLICKFSIKVKVHPGQQASEWITKINSLTLMMRAQGMHTAETQWGGCSTKKLAWEMRERCDTVRSNHCLMKTINQVFNKEHKSASIMWY